MKAMLGFIRDLLFIIVASIALFAYAMFQGGFVSWFLFYGFLPILLYHFCLLLYPIKNWKATRRLNHSVIHAGDEVGVTIELERSIPFPLFYCIVEELLPVTINRMDTRHEKYHSMEQPKQYYDRKVKRVIFPLFNRKFELSYKLSQVPRGEHRLTGIQVQTGDIFGFVKKKFVFPIVDQLTAYPNERPLRIIESVSSFEHGSITSSAQNLKNTNVATGVREYAPGDRFSWIDWKQTARKNAVMTKEFEQEKNTNMLVILDTCNYQGMNTLAFEATIELTLSLMETIRKQATQVGLVSIGQNINRFPNYDTTTSNVIKRHLTRLEPTGVRPFSLILKEEMRELTSGEIVILITTHLDDFFKQTVQQMCQRMNQVAVIFIQSSALIKEREQQIIKQLEFSSVSIQVLTEQQLVQNPIEVSFR
ncbi:DUF58 domain-containing protein [Oceanobacillus chungangensis]|uniref:DUF58 domain-containing protein n=1 Tax=Oceanobacillus chungangensis TaxID=1229152 RepID=A0A3D8PS12_9BACI|nr:DUF58 domain-containing protein [Oceanobacillus chungangensis]RDW18916.1 DUF58 domain-containing protein [Oceanobacillus chungangensis]